MNDEVTLVKVCGEEAKQKQRFVLQKLERKKKKTLLVC